MSYRLISKAAFTIVSANGDKHERQAEVRAYAAPKRAADGAAKVDGVDVEYRLTGGKGRGTAVRNYLYVPARGESAYIEITSAELTMLKGATISLTLDPIPVAKVEEPKAEEAQPAEEQAPTEIPAKLTRAQRRAAAKQTA